MERQPGKVAPAVIAGAEFAAVLCYLLLARRASSGHASAQPNHSPPNILGQQNNGSLGLCSFV